MSIGDKLLKSAAAGGLTPSENFKVITYTGTGSSNSITGVGFKPDFVWIKNRGSAQSHSLTDSTRGNNLVLQSNETSAEASGQITLDSDGFTIGNDNALRNASGNTYVAWCWKANGGTTSSNGVGSITSTVQANTDAGFSIVKYVGNVTAGATVGHGLGAVPKLIILKNMDRAGYGWLVYHGALGATRAAAMNNTDAFYTGTNYFNDTNPTSTVFSLGSDTFGNYSGDDYIAYCFAEISGFSKFGSYAGNGSENGPIVETGFEVGYLMIKRVDSGDNWYIVDNARSTSNPRQAALFANLNDAEYATYGAKADFLSNGFQIVSTDNSTNASGGNFVYMAFATDPDTEAPTLASSFNIELYTGTKPDSQNITGFGFDPDFVWIKNRDSSDFHSLLDSVRGQNVISSDSTDAQSAFTAFDFITDGFSIANSGQANESGDDFVAWSWKANDDVPTIEAVNTDTDAIAIYKFEDNVDDVTGNYDGTATSISYVTGKFNKAADFNGSSSKITSTPGITGNAVFSISFWIKPEAVNGTPFLFGTTTAGQAFLTFVTASNKLNFGSWGDSLADSTASIPLSTWTNVVISNNAGSVQVYINGVADVSFSHTFNITGDNLCLGAANTSQYFEGELDQVRLYDKALTAASATNLYNETTAQNDTLDIGTQYQSSVTAIVSVNANAGFSISQATFASEGTIPHGLSQAPELVILKGVDAAEDWLIYHSAVGTGKYLSFSRNNGTDAPTTRADSFSSVTATSVTNSWTGSNVKWIMYSFHSVTGYQKIGSYTGDGNNDRAVTTGFKPDFVMIKSTVGSDNWRLYDTRRGIEDGGYLEPNRSDADDTSNAPNLTITSTGFTITSGGVTAGNNANGNLYIYWAMAQNVASNTTLANSFKAVTYTGNSASDASGTTQAITGLGFKPDLVWIKRRDGAENHYLQDSVRGIKNQVYSNLSNAEYFESTAMSSFDSDGFTLGGYNGINNNGETYVGWCWKAGNTWQSNIDGTIPSTVNVNTANGFSIVKYTATGSTATVGHGLSSAPDLIIGKTTNQAYDWLVYHTSLGNANAVSLQSNAASASNSFMNSTSPTSSVFTAGAGNNWNYADGNEIIAYCFHSVAGYSKFGTYSGSGSDGNAVSLGFQPDFVMIKRTNDTGGWLMFDSARNTSNPRNNRLEADSNAGATTGSATKFLDFNSTDFEANGSDTEVNASGSTYIYMAFKIN